VPFELFSKPVEDQRSLSASLIIGEGLRTGSGEGEKSGTL
jgi:hypothetical protein